MASSVQLGYALWQDGMTVNGQLGRVLDVASSWAAGGTATSQTVQGGVIASVGSMKVVATSGMTIQVSAGFCVIPNSTSNLQGAYKVGSMVANNLTVATSDPTNPRIDIVCATVFDDGASDGFSEVQIIAGTPAVSPVAPATPANSIVLAQVAVAANATSITSGNITDTRTYTSPGGGVTNWSTVASSGPGFNGLIAYDRTNDRFFHNNAGAGSGERFKSMPWAPVQATNGANVGITTSLADIKTATFTADGLTDIKITFSYPGIFQATMGLTLITWNFTLDSTSLQSFLVATRTDSGLAGTAYDGATFIYHTSPGTGDTPSAGTHTLHLKAKYVNLGSGTAPNISGSGGDIWYVRVEPVEA